MTPHDDLIRRLDALHAKTGEATYHQAACALLSQQQTIAELREELRRTQEECRRRDAAIAEREAEIARLRQSAMRKVRCIKVMPTDEQCRIARESCLFNEGDMVLRWVNEGDIIESGEECQECGDTALRADKGEGK